MHSAARSPIDEQQHAPLITQEEQRRFDEAVEKLADQVLSVTAWPAVIKSLYLTRAVTEKSEDFLPLLDKLSQDPVVRDAEERKARLQGLTALKRINDLWNDNSNLRTHILFMVMGRCNKLYRYVGYGLYQVEQGIPLTETDDNRSDAERNGRHHITSQHDKRIEAERNISGSPDWREYRSLTPPSPPLSTAQSETSAPSATLPTATMTAQGTGTMPPTVVAAPRLQPEAENLGGCFSLLFNSKRAKSRRPSATAAAGAPAANPAGHAK
jgi:hypothetical protein